MGKLLDIMAQMATIAQAADAVKTGYPTPPEAPPAAVNLPALYVRPSSDEPSEIEWRASREDYHHQLTMYVFATPRSENLQDDYSAVVPVLYAVIAAFREHSSLGLGPTVSGLHPTSYLIGPLGYLDAVYLGVTIQWAINERIAVTLE